MMSKLAATRSAKRVSSIYNTLSPILSCYRYNYILYHYNRFIVNNSIKKESDKSCMKVEDLIIMKRVKNNRLIEQARTKE